MENVRVVPRFETDARIDAVREGAPDKLNPLDSEAGLARLRRLNEWMEDEAMRQSTWRYQMATDEDFYDGIQIDEDDASTLFNRGQAPLVYNKTATSVDWVTGTERRTKVDWRVFPRSDNDRNEADNKTKLMKYVDDVNKASFTRSRAFTDAVKVGVGWLEAGLSGDPTRFLIYDRYESWRNMLWDSRATDLELLDARYVLRRKWTDLDIATSMYPERRHALYSAATYNDMADLQDIDEFYLGQQLADRDRMGNPMARMSMSGIADGYTNRRSRVQMHEMWYYMPARVQLMVGGPLSGVPFMPDEDLHTWLLHKQACALVERTMMMSRCAVFIKGTLLADWQSPYRHNRFPFTPVWGNRRGRDGMPYGMVRNMRDPQESFNKRMSKALFILSSRRIEMEENAVADIEDLREEAARPDAIITYRKGYEFAMHVDTDLAEEHLKLAELDSMMIEHVAGVTDELLGRRTNATSGKAIEARQDQGSTVTTKYFDNHRLAIQCHGQKRLSLCEQFISFPMQIRVIGERKGYDFVELNKQQATGEGDDAQSDILNDITRAQADFVVSTQDFRESLRQATFEQLMDMATKLGTIDPQLALRLIDDILEFSDIPGVEEIIKTIRDMTGKKPRDYKPTDEEMRADAEKKQQEQAVAAKVQELQLAALEADVAKTFAEVDALKAKAEDLRGGPDGDGGAAKLKLMQIQMNANKLVQALRERVQQEQFKAAMATSGDAVKEKIARLDAATKLLITDRNNRAKFGIEMSKLDAQAEAQGDQFEQENLATVVQGVVEEALSKQQREHEAQLAEKERAHALTLADTQAKHTAALTETEAKHTAAQAEKDRKAQADKDEADRKTKADEEAKASKEAKAKEDRDRETKRADDQAKFDRDQAADREKRKEERRAKKEDDERRAREDSGKAVEKLAQTMDARLDKLEKIVTAIAQPKAAATKKPRAKGVKRKPDGSLEILYDDEPKK